ncbi:MAG: hypothetical protein Q9177_000186 [Variospora cf. flavescens]
MLKDDSKMDGQVYCELGYVIGEGLKITRDRGSFEASRTAAKGGQKDILMADPRLVAVAECATTTNLFVIITFRIVVSHQYKRLFFSHATTLLCKNLLDPSIFHPTSLLQIRTLISNHTLVHSFSPLKSLRRIIASFYTVSDAFTIHRILSDAPIMSSRARVYFGEPTPIEVTDRHLQAPRSQKMFFISPPPSPPFGWEVRPEGPPNKEVHADDLASALGALRQRSDAVADEIHTKAASDEREENRGRKGSTTTMVYEPERHGGGPGLPAVVVEDMTCNGDTNPIDGGKILAHTARPPVELMQDT